MTKEVLAVDDVHRWFALTASVLVEASAYDDRAEVAWFSQLSGPNVTFEARVESEKDRRANLGTMHPNILQAKIGRAVELGWLVATRSQHMYRAGNLITGRWKKVLDNMSTKLDDDALRDLLLEQRSESKEFESGVEAYEREPGMRTYGFLTGSIERFLSKHTMKRNRQRQAASSSKPDPRQCYPCNERKGKRCHGRGRSRGRWTDVGSRGAATLRLPDQLVPIW